MTKQIKLTQNKVALVDDEDYEWLNQFKWYACKYGVQYYALRKYPRKQKILYMHREILKLTPNDGKLSDHINHNGLDNRRNNLRIVTRIENQWNRRSFKGESKYRGVSKYKRSNKWRARLTRLDKEYYLGYFDNEIYAAKAYDRKAKEIFGEFAVLNFND